MDPLIKRLKRTLIKQVDLIASGKVGIANQLVLTRSLLESYSILNFLLEHHTRQRVELFHCFGDFEWYSHSIFRFPRVQRPVKFLNFLKRTRAQYPYGFCKYCRLIKRRLCKALIKSHQQSKLNLLNSDKPQLRSLQLQLVADYMTNHLITKLPFPYRIAFGKGITYFVLKYSPLDRNTYWLLADLSHGTLWFNHLNSKVLSKIIRWILKTIKKDLENR